METMPHKRKEGKRERAMAVLGLLKTSLLQMHKLCCYQMVELRVLSSGVQHYVV